ncbi:MAG: MFS transporter [Deltaproteobacteria bacterium]|nr:MFS transporter [Deltaproteobacteria bacterium]
MPLLTRNFVLLVIAHFLQAAGYSSLLLLPLYLQHLGASRTEIGVVMATAGVSGLLSRPLVAWGLDGFGRKPTLLVGTVTLVVGMALIGAVDSIGWVVYLARAIIGIGIGALFTGYFTFAADVIPVSRRTEGLALFGISGLVPLLVNPLSDQIGVGAPDLRWFLPIVAIVVASSALVLLWLPEPSSKPAEHKSIRGALTALRQRPLWPVWFATTAFSAMVAVFMTFVTVAAERRGVDDAASHWFAYAVGAVLVRAIGARLPDRVGPANLIAPAMAVYVVGLMLAAQAVSFEDFLVASLCAGLGHGYCFPILTSQVVTRASEAFLGSALALFTALWGVSELIVSPLFGAVADHHGDEAMFWLAAASGIACMALWLVLEHRLGGATDRRPTVEPPSSA